MIALKREIAGVTLREDMSVLDGRDDRQRAELIEEQLAHWKSTQTA